MRIIIRSKYLHSTIVLIALLFTAVGISQTDHTAFKIACVGNSITYGAGMVDREHNAWPHQLQEILGSQYKVENFGKSGRTLLHKGDLPYIETEEYKNALKFSPDIVFIMLGTNDSKLQNRRYIDEFENDYKQLISDFKAQNEKVRTVLLLPVPSFLKDTSSIWDPLIKGKVIPKIQKVAYDTGSELIDLYQLFAESPELLPDTIHPSPLGASLIAKRISESVLQTLEINSTFVFPTSEKKVETGNFYGYRLTDFKLNGYPCKLVEPKRTAPGKPWVLRARFFGHEPQTDIALLERGFHIAYCDVAGLFGDSQAQKRWDEFYRYMRKNGFSKKVVLEGMSRGGLIVYNWAAKNPEKVACVYADAPVLDGKSWPGGLGKGKGSDYDWNLFKEYYKLTSEKDIEEFKDNPLYKTRRIAKGGYPMMHVVGDADEVVPVAENTLPFEEQILEHGGNIQVISKPGVGHHPHSLKNPKPIVDFILSSTGYKFNFAQLPIPSGEYRSGAGWKNNGTWWDQAAEIDSICMATPDTDLLLLGNSITQGWGNRPAINAGGGNGIAKEDFSKFKWINAGISGDRTSQLLYRIKNGHYHSSNAKTIILTIGVNNFLDNDSAEEIASGIQAIVELLQKKFSKDTRILLYGPLPTGVEADSERRTKFKEIHNRIKELGKRSNVFYHNLHSEFTDEKGDLNMELYAADGIHLRTEGYRVWAKNILNDLKISGK